MAPLAPLRLVILDNMVIAESHHWMLKHGNDRKMNSWYVSVCTPVARLCVSSFLGKGSLTVC